MKYVTNMIYNVVRVVMTESSPTLLNIISLETSFQPMNFGEYLKSKS